MMPGPVGSYDDTIMDALDERKKRWKNRFKNIEGQMESNKSIFQTDEGVELGPLYDTRTSQKLPFTQKELRLKEEQAVRSKKFMDRVHEADVRAGRK